MIRVRDLGVDAGPTRSSQVSSPTCQDGAAALPLIETFHEPSSLDAGIRSGGRWRRRAGEEQT